MIRRTNYLFSVVRKHRGKAHTHISLRRSQIIVETNIELGLSSTDEKKPQSSHLEFGVFRQDETDDIQVMVNNFTAPALAKALRDKEVTLQKAARLSRDGKLEELNQLLFPYLSTSMEIKRSRNHDINIVEHTEGLTRKDLVILQRYLHRMPRHVSKPSAKRASVVIPLCNVNGSASILFEKRSDKVRTHKQQACFPGGMVEEGVDATIIQTSLRELEEELGIPQASVEVLGILRCNWTEVTSFTGIAVTPVVGFIGDMANLNLKPNPDEVEYLFTVSLEELLDPSRWTSQPFSPPVFTGETEVVWGLTAYLLERFVKDVLVKCSLSSGSGGNKVDKVAPL